MPVVKRSRLDRIFLDDWGQFKIGWLLALCFTAIMVGTRSISHHYAAVNCHKYSQTTGRYTKFVDFTYWNWECLTPAKDGKLIPTDKLVGVK